MKSNNLMTWVLGLAALGVTVYVVGRAWKMSQASKGATKVVDADEQATFVDDYSDFNAVQAAKDAAKKAGQSIVAKNPTLKGVGNLLKRK